MSFQSHFQNFTLSLGTASFMLSEQQHLPGDVEEFGSVPASETSVSSQKLAAES